MPTPETVYDLLLYRRSEHVRTVRCIQLEKTHKPHGVVDIQALHTRQTPTEPGSLTLLNIPRDADYISIVNVATGKEVATIFRTAPQPTIDGRTGRLLTTGQREFRQA